MYRHILYLKSWTRACIGMVLVGLCCSGCKKYLNAPTDKSLVIPSTITDAQSLMDDYSIMNGQLPAIGLLSDDDYYLNQNDYNASSSDEQVAYGWGDPGYNDMEYGIVYTALLTSNVALTTLEGIQPTDKEVSAWNLAAGSAYFFRGFYHLQAAQYWAVPYDSATAATDLGIPLKLSNSSNDKIERATIEKTYDQVIADLKVAISLLPVKTTAPTRPSKAAAYGALARTFLQMRKYDQALLYADSSLQQVSNLMDYNDYDSTAFTPFPQFNEEVLFQANVLGHTLFGPPQYNVDSALYTSYDPNDLRRALFFSPGADGGANAVNFKGYYDPNAIYGTPFVGICVDEMFLVRAECYARAGNKANAMADLNGLLSKRWRSGRFAPFTATDAEDALMQVLTERRKELLTRGTRWLDLRRLNKEAAFAVTLTRSIGGNMVTLPPNDPRYVFLFPEATLKLSGIEQNQR
jgi:tetratricopeptide (TPR) repeat protein